MKYHRLLRKKIFFLTFLLCSFNFSYSQEDVDMVTPANGQFIPGNNIQGTIETSINESTGKVVYPENLATIMSSSLSYSIGIAYNGQEAFKEAQQTNKYNPTSIVGVGWSIAAPKIVVDHKGTGTRFDDDFYLIDGTTSTKLLCTNIPLASEPVNGDVWKFQMQKYAPWEIEYHYHSGWRDYWKITKDDGIVYYYGNSSSKNGKEFAVRYGNWIGDSKQSGATSEHTIVWNITKIEDLWGNNLTFNYEMVKQVISGKDQTEASYLTSIESSKGAKIQLAYGNKSSDEYYQPHIEASEPDAYHERYDKKYLNEVLSYNNNNQIVNKFTLGYTLKESGLNKKRYLTSLTQTSYNDNESAVYPLQTFEYYYTGTFKGGLKKITYPTGGTVQYNYENKFLFNNTANLFETPFVQPANYVYHSMYVSDDYSIYVHRSKDPIQSITTVSGVKEFYEFKFYRFYWNGQQWEWDEFTFPDLIEDYRLLNDGGRLKDFYVVLEKDFYGFAHVKGFTQGNTAKVHLFSKHSSNYSGHNWNHNSFSVDVGEGSPIFISGDKFIALLGHRNGSLTRYTLNGRDGFSWNSSLSQLGPGQYYASAKNNFIVVLDEDGGPDLNTSFSSYQDNYYVFYLDPTRKWKYKSWSEAADPFINGIQDPSHFYPDNSMVGFMADNNPELFLRWDINYNLTNVDTNVFGYYSDELLMQPVNNSMFTIYNHFYKTPLKFARFNGVSWKPGVLPNASSTYYGKLNFGKDIAFFENHPTINGIGYHKYNPNTNSWNYGTLNYAASSNYWRCSSNQEFTIANNKIYEISNAGTFNQIETLGFDNRFTFSDGLNHSYVTDTYNNGSFYYIDKTNGLLNNIYLGQKSSFSSKSGKFGGYSSFISPKAIWLKQSTSDTEYDEYFYRIIDDKFNNPIYDIVVSKIDINDDNGIARSLKYIYNNPRCSPDNSSTFYNEVIKENIGTGSGNIGKVFNFYSTANSNLVGLQYKTVIKDNNGITKKENTTSWDLLTKEISISGTYFYDSKYLRVEDQTSEDFFENESNFKIKTEHLYNDIGLKTSTTTINSSGKDVVQEYVYGYEEYSFVNEKNILSIPYQTITKIDDEVVNIEQNIWAWGYSNIPYIKEKWSGSDATNLRLNNEITNVDNLGNVLETSNGKNIYSSVLKGYSNLYEVASIVNARHQDVVNELDVTYSQLQNLNTSNLKVELMKLYNRLPDAMISLTFYDDNGRVINRVNERKEESYIYYDQYGRVDYITDGYGKVIEKKEYNFGN